MSSPEQGVTIGPREIYDEVIAIKLAVAGLVNVDAARAAAEADHESRLRVLESRRIPPWLLIVIPSVIAVVLFAIDHGGTA